MELAQKLEVLADAAKYDASCASSGAARKGGKGLGHTTGSGICHSYTPDGRCVSLLKILLTNYCIFDCQYCVNRVSSDVRRARFTVDEVVRLTIDFYKRNYIEGLFLSSGIIRNADYTMEQLVLVAKKLRTEERFGGYIHLKTVPEASPALIDEAGRWADRLSINIELPTDQDLRRLAPDKRRGTIESGMDEMAARIGDAKEARRHSRKAPLFAPAGQSTQMIVGATPTPDAEILKTSHALYNRYRLRRVYYSAFSPIPHGDPRLPLAAPPLVREHRLYQADWLMRFYGFAPEEITETADANLDLNLDPKLAWALRFRERFPVDINTSDRELLLRVPGLGTRNVAAILRARRFGALSLDDLRKLRVPLVRARAFITARGYSPHAERLDTRNDLRTSLAPPSEQLELFAAASARTGQL